jgi:transcriptional regulator with XRE-family HTH domain
MEAYEKLKYIRGALGLQQKQLAYIFNVKPAAVCRWERQAAVPDGSNMQLIDVLYLNLKKTGGNDLAEIRAELIKLLRFASPLGCLNALLHDLIVD